MVRKMRMVLNPNREAIKLYKKNLPYMKDMVYYDPPERQSVIGNFFCFINYFLIAF